MAERRRRVAVWFGLEGKVREEVGCREEGKIVEKGRMESGNQYGFSVLWRWSFERGLDARGLEMVMEHSPMEGRMTDDETRRKGGRTEQ